MSALQNKQKTRKRILPFVTEYGKYTAKVGQDNVNIGVVTIFRLANTRLQVHQPEEGWCWPAEIL